MRGVFEFFVLILGSFIGSIGAILFFDFNEPNLFSYDGLIVIVSGVFFAGLFRYLISFMIIRIKNYKNS